MHPDMIDPTPGKRCTRTGSLTDRLLSLARGEETTLTRYMDPASDDLSEEGLSAAKTGLTAKATKAVSRAKTGAAELEFQTESAAFITTRNRLYVAVLITRTA